MSTAGGAKKKRRAVVYKEKQKCDQWLSEDERVALARRTLSTVDADSTDAAVQTTAKLMVLEVHTVYADRIACYMTENYSNLLRVVGLITPVCLALESTDTSGVIDVEQWSTIIRNDVLLPRVVWRFFWLNHLSTSVKQIFNEQRIAELSDCTLRLVICPANRAEEFGDAIDLRVKLSPTTQTHSMSFIVLSDDVLLWSIIDDRFCERNFSRNGLTESEIAAGVQPVSRAFFKIREAHLRGLVEFKETDKVIDMGAAPGGWTQYIAPLVREVIAVDPAKLTIEITPKIRHVRKKIQDCMEDLGKETIDVIVDDIIASSFHDSIEMVRPACELLREHGVLVLTLKTIGRRREFWQGVEERASNTFAREMPYMHIQRFVHLFANTSCERCVIAVKDSTKVAQQRPLSNP